MKMRMFAYALLILCISFGLSFFGYTTNFGSVMTGSPNAWGDIINVIGQNIVNIGVVALIIGALVSFGLLNGFSAIYIVAMLLFVASANYLFLPFSPAALTQSGDALQPYILAFFNILLFASILEWIKGGG